LSAGHLRIKLGSNETNIRFYCSFTVKDYKSERNVQSGFLAFGAIVANCLSAGLLEGEGAREWMLREEFWCSEEQYQDDKKSQMRNIFTLQETKNQFKQRRGY
jgi:hypothetical protein